MKFRFSKDFVVDTETSPWKTEGLRVGLWGGSGSGKSNTAALFAEQFLSQGGVLVAFEPRAEYHTLKEKFDVVVCGGPYSKDLDFVPSSPATYAKAVVENGVSLIFYTSDVEDEAKLIEFVSKFLHYLVKYNEVVKRPIMLLTEETEEYTPMSTRGRVSPPWVFSRMIRRFKTVQRDARKLNIVTVNLSPRPQEVNFTIRQLCNLTLYGKFSAQDASYVDRECLKPLREKGRCFYKGADLTDLKTGQFAVILSGKSIPIQTITEPRMTRHGAETPKLEYTAPRTEETQKTVTNLAETIKKALEKERREQSELEKAKRKIKDLEKKLAAAEEKAKIKLSVKEMLKAGSEPVELAEKLAKAEAEITQLKEERAKLDNYIKETAKHFVEVKEKADAFENLQKALAPFLPTQAAGPPGFEPGTVPQGHDIQLQATTTIVGVPPAIKHAKINDETMQGKVLTVAKKGVLDSWRKLGDIVRAIREERWNATPQQVNNALNDLVKQQLIAKKHTDRNYFCLAKNVKFKEAEA